MWEILVQRPSFQVKEGYWGEVLDEEGRVKDPKMKKKGREFRGIKISLISISILIITLLTMN